jgi:hypothetical protein
MKMTNNGFDKPKNAVEPIKIPFTLSLSKGGGGFGRLRK